METIKPNAILKFNKKQLQKVRKELGYEDVKVLKRDIEELRDWIQKQDHFLIKDFDDFFLENWLICNKGLMDRSKLRFDKLCTYTSSMPEFLRGYDVKNEFHPVHTMTNHLFLPKPTSDNYRILITHLTGVNDKEFTLLQAIRYNMLFIKYLLNTDYCFGYEWIGDLRLLTWGLITKINPIVMHKSLKIFVEALARRVRRLHMLSDSKFFSVAIMVIKQGLSAKLRDRIIIHKSVESLYEYFPKEQLPKELGGYERSMKEIKDQIFQELCTDESIAKIKFMEQIGTDESKRLSH